MTTIAHGQRLRTALGCLKRLVDRPLVFNQIAGGKSPRVDLTELNLRGVSLVVYSTPCLFAAQAAIGEAMQSLQEHDGLLADPAATGVDVALCNELLHENLRRRDQRSAFPAIARAA